MSQNPRESFGFSVDVSPSGLREVNPAPPAPPGVLGMAASFATSMAKFAAGGFKTVDPGVHRVRVEQCGPCEHRRESRCQLCGCFIDKKAWLPHEDCPIGRWPA